MRMSQLVAPTLREDPSEAEVVSHKLLLRAGFIRKLSAGIYNYLPLGWRVLSNVTNIVREEMNRSGAQEVLLPALIPAELWSESGRWGLYGKELFRIQDRHDREFCLGPTHEEVITDLVRTSVRSYKQLPLNLYQIQTKFRDEIRPRFGLMRGREFVMKDAYSFHTSDASLDQEYQNMYQTYCRIFDRLGLKYRVVEADPGLIGGGYSQEFMVLADTGEEEIFYCACGYTASRDSAGVAEEPATMALGGESAREKVHTPKVRTIEEVSSFLGKDPKQFIKSIIYKTDKGFCLALVRGDHAVNEAKLKKLIDAETLEMAGAKEIKELTGAAPGFAGPAGLLGKIKIIADFQVPKISSGVCGANEDDHHFVNVVYGVDYQADQLGDIRYAVVGDKCPRCIAGHFEVCRGIEVGHIFKLGTKYSAKMNCSYLDEKNQEQIMIMGCYGIGVSRTVAAAIEQNNDKDGIIWPLALAPFKTALVPANITDPDQAKAAQGLYEELRRLGVEVLFDDRDDRLGVKLKDIDLIGIPYKVIIGKALKEGKVEIKERRSGTVTLLPVVEVAAWLKEVK